MSGSGFKNGRHARCLVQGDVDAFGYQVQTFVLGHLVQMRTGMEVKQFQTKQLGAVHLVVERLARQSQFFLVRTAEIDKKVIVRQYYVGRVTELLAIPLEVVDGGRRRLLGYPSVAGTGKQCECLGSDFVCRYGRVLYAA